MLKYRPEIFEHPHALIVRNRIQTMLEKITNAHAECEPLLILNHATQKDQKLPREHMRVRVMAGDRYLNPIQVKFERRAHLPLVKRNVRGWSNAYTASVNALPFFRRNNNIPYYWEDNNTDFWPSDVSSELFNCLRMMEEYCLFKSDVYLPEVDEVIKDKGRLKIYVILRDEYLASNDYDFIACIRIDSPNEANRCTNETMERIARHQKLEIA